MKEEAKYLFIFIYLSVCWNGNKSLNFKTSLIKVGKHSLNCCFLNYTYNFN